MDVDFSWSCRRSSSACDWLTILGKWNYRSDDLSSFERDRLRLAFLVFSKGVLGRYELDLDVELKFVPLTTFSVCCFSMEVGGEGSKRLTWLWFLFGLAGCVDPSDINLCHLIFMRGVYFIILYAFSFLMVYFVIFLCL